MQSKAATVLEYMEDLPDDRKPVMGRLRETILLNLPEGFTEQMSYGMVGYVVPHSIYPSGYHCSPELPLPFISIASQKNFIGFYHMGMYADRQLLDWFVAEYPQYASGKLDMGKSCIRFKKQEQIPFELIGELVARVTVDQWVQMYERNYRGK
jgi:uncharacterized protein YdhG (YjbR/CyaY superfamily)